MSRVIGFVSVLFIFTSIDLQKLSAQSTISQAQAVFVYNFTRFIEWPTEYKSGDFVIGIFGATELYSELKKFSNGKMVGNQHIVVTNFISVENIGKCHILFVPFAKTKEMPTVLGMLGGSKTLIITEKKGALQEGSAINFVIVEDKLKFELKGSNASKVGLKIHSNLENMAIAKY